MKIAHGCVQIILIFVTAVRMAQLKEYESFDPAKANFEDNKI
jgi:hypothetical protein